MLGGVPIWHVFPQPDHQLLVATEQGDAVAEARRRMVELGRALADVAEFEEPVTGEEGDLVAEVERRRESADAILVQVSSVLDPRLWAIDAPILAWSGERTPMMGLYNLPLSERRAHPNVTLCLDQRELRAGLVGVRAAQVVNRLRETRMIALGAYASADRLPDPERLREVMGVELVQVPAADFLSLVDQVDAEEAAQVGRAWAEGARRVDEPDATDVDSAARIHVALSQLLARERAQAVSVGCLEFMYAHECRPFCWVLASLRDQGLPAGCEADAAATLTLLAVEYLAERPGYMGNLVAADPEAQTIAISHGCSPTRMRGRDVAAIPYRLVHSHSVPPFSRDLSRGSGLTSYVEYDRGQEVTIARLCGDLETFLVTGGEITDCQDTICDRTTVTVRVPDARRFVQLATGNHQCLFYGNLVDELHEVGRQLGLEVVDPAH